MSIVRQVGACVALLVAASVLPAQTVFGKYSLRNPQGGLVVLTLESAGGGKIKGSLSGNGITFTIQGELDEGDAAGTMRGPSGAAYFEASREGRELQVMIVEMGADGTPNLATTRQLVFTLDESAAVPRSEAKPQGAAMRAPAAAPGISGTAPQPSEAPAPSSPQDQQLSRLLLSSAWCSFSYSGSSTYAGVSGGRTSSSRVVFSTNGLMQQTSGTESTNSGAAGAAWGSNSSAQAMRWRVQNGALLLSQDGTQWQTIQLQVTQNSNGYPIVKADGTEYMQCR